jgi:hypothetical protein
VQIEKRTQVRERAPENVGIQMRIEIPGEDIR